eukprot:5206857-Ditylum_brightwellii.AAC.1
MKEAAEHIPFQLPNEFTRFGFLLATIKCSDTVLQDTMSNIKNDTDEKSATNKRHNVEVAATYLLPFCQVLRKFPVALSVMPSR